MSTRNDNESVLKQVAEVRMGEYDLHLREEDLAQLYREKEIGDPGYYPHFIDGIIDSLISYACEDDDRSKIVMPQLGILQDIKGLYKFMNELDIIKRKESVR